MILTLICLRKDTHRNEIFEHIQRITFWNLPRLSASHLHRELVTDSKDVRKFAFKFIDKVYVS